MTIAGVLAGQHALVTGGGSGIGLATARALVADGATVTLVGRNSAKLGDAADELGAGDQVRTAVADVGDEPSISVAIDAANAHARLTIAIVNAGTGGAGPILAMDLDEWERVLRTNLTGAFLTIKHAGAKITANGGGAMCAISSIAGTHTHRFMSSYTTSKAGLNMLVRNATDELGSLGVRINAVAPGIVETELSAALQATDEVDTDYRRNMPLGRRGMPDDIASAVRFLVGPESSWITGAILPVDGGNHLRRGPNIDPLLAPFINDLPPLSAEV
jgi:NAD(P)-dependent dehydrogenase (short-subunit alcohol dehydrogenase family)